MATETRRVEVVTTVPAVAVQGTVLGCCRRGPIDAAMLRAAGVGQV